MVVVKEGEAFRFEHEHFFDYHQYGSDTGIPNGRIEIRKGSDGQYWNGSTFVASQTWNTTTVDGGGLFDYYDFTIPSGTEDDTFNVRMQHNSDPSTEALFLLQVRDLSGAASGSGVFDAVAFALSGDISFR